MWPWPKPSRKASADEAVAQTTAAAQRLTAALRKRAEDRDGEIEHVLDDILHARVAGRRKEG